MLTYVFCGYGPECKPSRAPRNSYLWTMARVAADRLEAEFVVVGLLEEFRNFFRVLEVGPLNLFVWVSKDSSSYARLVKNSILP